MTTLSAHTTRAIHNKGMQAVYGIAAEYDVPVEDVIALLGTTSHTSITGHHSPFVRLESTTPSQPLQPSSDAPAADTSTMPPVDEATDGEGLSSSLPSSPSVDPISDIVIPISPTPSPVTGDPADGAGIPQNRAPAPSAAFSPAPKRISHRQRIRDCHAAHPDWTARQVSRELGLSTDNVWSIASQIGIKWPNPKQATTDALRKAVEAETPTAEATPAPQGERSPAAYAGRVKGKPIKHQVFDIHSKHPDWDAKKIAGHIGANLGTVVTALSDARAAANESLREPPPAPNPQTPVAPPPTGEHRTLTERIRTLHQQHPALTATLIAKELGANLASVSTILRSIRGKAAPSKPAPEFTGRRAMIEHYGEIAKRLGKAK